MDMTNVINLADHVANKKLAKELATRNETIARREKVIAIWELKCEIETVERQIKTFMDLSKEFAREDEKFIALSMANDERRKLVDLQQQLAAVC